MPHRVNIKSSVHSSQTPSVGEDNGGTFTGKGRHRKKSGVTWFKPEWLRKSFGRGVRCKGIEGGGGGADILTPKYLSGPKSKAKRTRIAQTIGIPSLLRGDGESERSAGLGSAGGRACCLPKISVYPCVCASQPTNNTHTHKNTPTTKYQTVSSPDLKTTTTPYSRLFQNWHAQCTSQTPTLPLTWAPRPPSVIQLGYRAADLCRLHPYVELKWPFVTVREPRCPTMIGLAKWMLPLQNPGKVPPEGEVHQVKTLH